MGLIDVDPSRRVIGCAIEVHRILGPGPLESIYEACVCRELAQVKFAFIRQQRLPVIYKGESVDCDLIADICRGIIVDPGDQISPGDPPASMKRNLSEDQRFSRGINPEL